ncbi:hypothetical protein [Paenibacillus flagellatus]|uniref:Uncharacterized protein n=1 Tax=Paenibacillus flagellatus TaxID=2211139 RepID=A0A2V5K557_9BACL|nr:hypothetical protein [Paenibacillus flagellatus]PYI53872.1 hypothetical protein DLM86_15055 [Paenibacillus flagellatus]
MIWPQRFDANEWFLLSALAVMAVLFFVMPRRFPKSVTIVFLALGVGIPMYADFLIAPKPFDLYDVNDTGNYELFEILFYFVYAPFAYFFVYFFDRWNVRGLGIAGYVVVWSAFAVAFEALAARLHVFHYKGWTLGYSSLVYLVVQSLYLAFYYRIKRTYAATKRESAPEWK